MHTPRQRRLALFIALGLALAPFLRAADSPPARPQFFTGKVVPLASLLEKIGSKLDKDAQPHWLALVSDDGKIYPLIKDAGSRMFFADKEMLNRPMRLTGRTFENSNLLQVLQVHSLVNGQLHDVYYWCDVCQIKIYEKRDCECCGAPVERREPAVH
jgi:hypothetical protein